MITIRDLKFDNKSLGEQKFLVDVTAVYEYSNGVRTDKITGYRYVVALPAHNLKKLGVKIEGDKLMEKPEGFAEVTFTDLEVRAYESKCSSSKKGVLLWLTIHSHVNGF